MRNRHFQRWLWVLFSMVLFLQFAAFSSSPTAAPSSMSNTYFTASGTASPTSLTRSQTLTITGTFSAKQALSNVNVDLEVRSTSHAKLLQKYYLGENFASGQTKTYTWNVVIPSTMAPTTYNVVVAVFSANWGTVYIWYEPATTFQVVSGTVPAAPSGLVAAVLSSAQINLTWTDNAGNESGFKIERSLDGASYAQIATVGAGVQAYANPGLTEPIPLLACGSRCGSSQSPETPQSRPRCAPSGRLNDDISSETRQTCARLGTAAPLF